MKGRWPGVRDLLKPGDFVLMQFGTNSEGQASFTENLHKYVAEIQAKQATPIICTLVPRDAWAADKLRRTDPHAVWARSSRRRGEGPTLGSEQPRRRPVRRDWPRSHHGSFRKQPHTNRQLATPAKVIADAIKTAPDDPLAKFLSETPAANW